MIPDSMNERPVVDNTARLPLSKSAWRVAIIGGGFSGVATAINLLRTATPDRPVSIRLIEKAPDQVCGGVAYGQAGPEHYTNIPSRLMSIFPEDPGHLSRWMVDAGLAPDVATAAEQLTPRRAYQHYLADALNTMAKQAAAEGRAELRMFEHEVVSIASDSKTIEYADGQTSEHDAIVLATGHLKPPVPGFMKDISASDQRDKAMSDAAVEGWKLRQFVEAAADKPRTGHTAMVFGTGLSAYDIAMSLKRMGYFDQAKNKLVLVSRNGRTHPHSMPPADMARQVAELRPELENYLNQRIEELVEQLATTERRPGYKTIRRSPEALAVRAAKDVYGRFSTMPDIDYDGPEATKQYSPAVVTQAIMPLLPGIVRRSGLSRETITRLLKDHGALINTTTVGVGPEVSRVIDALKESGQLEIRSAAVHGVAAGKKGKLAVKLTDKAEWDPTEVSVDFVASALPAETNFDKPSAGALYQMLMRSGLVRVDSALGIGIDCDSKRRVANSTPAMERIYAIGPQIAGHTMATEGMIGPFSLNVPTLRRHAQEVANQILEDRPGPSLSVQKVVEDLRNLFRGGPDKSLQQPMPVLDAKVTRKP